MIILFSLISFQGFSQTYTIPDTNLRNRLLAKHPNLMTGNQLNIALANSYAGSLYLDSSNISDASGIQFFTSAAALHLSNNNLTSIPQLAGLNQLFNIYLFDNKLTSLPNLTGFTNLWDYQVYNNQLTSLPSFAGMISLKSFYCGNNLLTSLPDISPAVNMEIMVISDNNFGALPDFSPLVKLKQLHVNHTGIDTIRGLANLVNLEELHCWGNSIRNLSALNANTKLRVFYAHDNQLHDLPNFSNKPFLNKFNGRENKLTFEDILPLSSRPFFNTFIYSPQDFIGRETEITLRKKDNYEINLNIDPLILDNQYKWYKNGVLLDSSSTGTRNFPSIDFSDAGTYTVTVNNPWLPSLTLTSYNYKINVIDCEGCSSIFSPDGDGVLDTYPILETGMARVYNISGKLIKEFPIPGQWDGSKSDGSMADAGYYAIVINGKKAINVSLFR